jgi:microcystin-dependent protein
MPYLGEIRIFAGNFAPAGWALCEGQLVAISENDALFTLIGTTYGGDGQETFGLPDLRGRLPVHQSPGSGFIIGSTGGTEEVTLTVNQMPAHGHAFVASQNAGNQVDPGGNMIGETVGGLYPYIADAPTVSMSTSAITPVGGSQPHTNLQPYLCVNYIISLYGIFPPRN